MPNSQKQAGFIPLIALVVAGIAILSGGTYLVRNEFIKVGKSGKIGLNTEKIQQQIKNPQALPSLSPTPKGEVTQGLFTYKPPESSASAEPSFTIMPPAGWEKLAPITKHERAAFRSPDVDKEDQEDNLVARAERMISIYIYPSNGDGLNVFAEEILANSQNTYEKSQLISNLPTTFAGLEARKLEVKFSPKNHIMMHAISYLMIKDGFWVQVAGNSMESAWGKRAGEIESSMKSFRFTN